MKNAKSIEVTVAPDGELKIDALGFKGAGCEQATRFLEQALGAVSERSRKREHLLRQPIGRSQELGR